MSAPDKASEDQAKIAGTAAFSKFVAVLQIIADQDAPLTIAQLAALSGYPRPTVYRILAALMAEGMVVENPRTRQFEVGPRLINLASRAWDRSDIRTTAIDNLRALRDATRETVHLAVPSDAGMVYIEKLESPQAVRMTSRIGTRVTLYSSSVGKAYLAGLEEERRERLMGAIRMERFTEHTITDLAALRAEIGDTQQRGYAEDREENEAQIFCYGAAIMGPDGVPAACISISIPLFRRQQDAHATYIRPLLETCAAISRKLAGPG
ncbi:IclR family transcriptional regulator [Herbaspirillum sp. LeCh32-8]|uniref:IclR family transcriptional regulator n=1 Tax=Herbaspirillum sp. LeCh32-8 TaxID=2821356 RepID=UPI001AE51196|nr:IclR family transcriptional regulator [Herbaspirillum sp. LeCh32-8]MBP0600673.1 IclR family transcriptional regulator [Herbaspirillum sp. LeCh32-8]